MNLLVRLIEQQISDTDTATDLSGYSLVGHEHVIADITDFAFPAFVLDDATDVTAATPANGDVLTWDSTLSQWVPDSSTSNSLAGMVDVTFGALSDLDIIVWAAATLEWVNLGSSNPALPWVLKTGSVSDVSDVTVTTPADLQALKWSASSSAWLNDYVRELYNGSTKVVYTDATYVWIENRALEIKDVRTGAYGEIGMLGADDGGSVWTLNKNNGGSPLTMAYILQDHVTNDLNILNYDGHMILETVNVSGTISLKHNSVTVLNTLTDGIVVTRRANIAPAAGDVASPANGDIWYNSTTAKFRAREAGVTVDLRSGSGGGGGNNYYPGGWS